MYSVHISLDMQLYMVAVQVKWSDPERWRAVSAHPGGMHNVMSFIGCIGRALVHQVGIFLNLCTICVDICIHGLNCSV